MARIAGNDRLKYQLEMYVIVRLLWVTACRIKEICSQSLGDGRVGLHECFRHIMHLHFIGKVLSCSFGKGFQQLHDELHRRHYLLDIVAVLIGIIDCVEVVDREVGTRSLPDRYLKFQFKSWMSLL